MQLIRRVEIKYFRSLYSFDINTFGDMNVIFGRNDSGKSNFLRALNLFFNNKVEPRAAFAPQIDLSDVRRAEAQKAKGKQFLYVKVQFNVPKNYQNALGQTLTVKRQWNLDGVITESFLPKSTTRTAARVTRFLNDIDFTYLPAVKDLSVFADLIERMYAATASSEAVQHKTVELVDAIGAGTTDLTQSLERIFGTQTALSAPKDMNRMFRNLDFTHGVEGHSMLLQKGDGIKARHLPELLTFVNEIEKRKKLFIWGFEEPENSLDLGAAHVEAARFAEIAASDNTQVFVTSHSPAFYLASGNDGAQTNRMFVSKQIKTPEGHMEPQNAVQLIDDIDAAEAAMEEAGLRHFPFVVRHLKAHEDQLREKNKDLKALSEEIDALKSQIQRQDRPTLFVEGQNDVNLFSASFARLGIVDDISIKAVKTPQTSGGLLGAIAKQGGISAKFPSLFLFDNDPAGRDAYVALVSGKGKPPGKEPVVINKTASVSIFAWCLPLLPRYRKFLEDYNIDPRNAVFVAEYLHPGEAAALIYGDQVLASSSQIRENSKYIVHALFEILKDQKLLRQLTDASVGSVDWFYSRAPHKDLKQAFAVACEDLGTEFIDGISGTIKDALLNSDKNTHD